MLSRINSWKDERREFAKFCWITRGRNNACKYTLTYIYTRRSCIKTEIRVGGRGIIYRCCAVSLSSCSCTLVIFSRSGKKWHAIFRIGKVEAFIIIILKLDVINLFDYCTMRSYWTNIQVANPHDGDEVKLLFSSARQFWSDILWKTWYLCTKDRKAQSLKPHRRMRKVSVGNIEKYFSLVLRLIFYSLTRWVSYYRRGYLTVLFAATSPLSSGVLHILASETSMFNSSIKRISLTFYLQVEKTRKQASSFEVGFFFPRFHGGLSARVCQWVFESAALRPGGARRNFFLLVGWMNKRKGKILFFFCCGCFDIGFIKKIFWRAIPNLFIEMTSNLISRIK